MADARGKEDRLRRRHRVLDEALSSLLSQDSRALSLALALTCALEATKDVERLLRAGDLLAKNAEDSYSNRIDRLEGRPSRWFAVAQSWSQARSGELQEKTGSRWQSAVANRSPTEGDKATARSLLKKKREGESSEVLSADPFRRALGLSLCLPASISQVAAPRAAARGVDSDERWREHLKEFEREAEEAKSLSAAEMSRLRQDLSARYGRCLRSRLLWLFAAAEQPKSYLSTITPNSRADYALIKCFFCSLLLRLSFLLIQSFLLISAYFFLNLFRDFLVFPAS